MLVEFLIYGRCGARRVALINIVIATLGVSIVLQNVARLVWGSEPLRYPSLFASKGLVLAGFVVSPQLVWIVILSALIMGRAHAVLPLYPPRHRDAGGGAGSRRRTPHGHQRRARDDAYTFAVSGMMAGAAGVLLGSLFFASFNMGFTTGIKAFVAATLGGLGSVPGAMVGGLLFGLIETFSGMLISTSYKDAVGMIVLIVILLFAPMGLFASAGRQV